MERLRAGIERVSKTVPFYRQKLSKAGVTADSIRSLDDLARLPFTTKSDLRDNYPYGVLAAPMKEVIRVHASSGTTGKPTVVAYTRNDISLPEVVDPGTGERLPDGEMGELVFTCVTKEALPLLRYRTRDLTRLTHEKCACGRTTVRQDAPEYALRYAAWPVF